jgi:hypothetical protein
MRILFARMATLQRSDGSKSSNWRRRALGRSPGERIVGIRGKAILAALLIAFTAPAAGEPRPVSAVCNREKLPGRGYIECLETALRESDRALTEAILRAQAQIDRRTDLAVTQRTRWKNALEEAQFIRFCNFDCQNVAPYEGAGGRIGAFEERLACLLEKNLARTQGLLRRYGAQ